MLSSKSWSLGRHRGGAGKKDGDRKVEREREREAEGEDEGARESLLDGA